MKITKSKLRQIIKEELDQEQIEQIINMYTSGDDDQQEQAIEIMRSMFDGDEAQDTTGIANSVYMVLTYVVNYDEVYTRIYGVFGSRQEAQEKIERVKKEHNVQDFYGDRDSLRIMAIPMGKFKVTNMNNKPPARFEIVDWLTEFTSVGQPKIV